MLAIKSINGVTPAIQPLENGYTVLQSDLLADGSGRSSETGRTFRYPIRLKTYKLTLKFKGTSAEISALSDQVSAFTQIVEFWYGGKYVTAEMYPSDRTVNDNGLTAELSVNLIET